MSVHMPVLMYGHISVHIRARMRMRCLLQDNSRAYIVMACIGIAYIVMAYIGMAHIVVALPSSGQ